MPIYCLLFQVKKPISVKVGSLGLLRFQKGYYIYTGSAQKNILPRIDRHFSKQKKIHWHIDYLTSNPYVECLHAFIKKGNKEQECITASKIKGIHILNFGCSDCRCLSHLHRLE